MASLNILFLCTGNSCRSQMAEAWAKKLRSDDINSYSAGVETHGLNPNAVKVMAEEGYDLTEHKSELVTDLPDIEFDYVVTLCGHAAENCPFFPGGSKRVHKGFPDPPSETKGMTDEEEILAVYRDVRDQIKEMVLAIPECLEE